MRFAIADDDKREIEMLLSYIKNNLSDVEAHCFGSGEELLGVWEKEKYDVVILDIFMGEKNGMEIARIIRNDDKDVRIVFATA